MIEPQSMNRTTALGSNWVFRIAIVLAMLVHLGLLLVHFTQPEIEHPTTIEISLEAPRAEQNIDAARQTDLDALDMPTELTLAPTALTTHCAKMAEARSVKGPGRSPIPHVSYRPRTKSTGFTTR